MGNADNVTAIFLQARLDSSRLPGKALLPLSGKTVIEHAMLALKQIDAAHHVLLTDEDSYKKLLPYCRESGFSCFAGDKQNVLKRFIQAAAHYKSKHIIRATGDNPLVSARMAKKLLALHIKENADYSGFVGMPLGAGVEVINTAALYKADALAYSTYDREHVCPFLYHHSEDFAIYRPQAPEEVYYPEGRITLDTPADYEFLSGLYRALYKGNEAQLELEEIIPYLAKQSRSLSSLAC